MSANPYDPVTTTDSTHLADDDWGLNLPSIKYNNYGSSRFKGICNFLRERSRLLIILSGILILGIILVTIIAIATHSSTGRKPTKEDRQTSWKMKGITFYPVPEDSSTVISFSVDKSKDPESHVVKSLTSVTEAYTRSKQSNNSIFTECTPNTHPPNKTCRLTSGHFGDVCVKHRGWGYPGAMPCILLQLNLPDNVVIKPISATSPLWPITNYMMADHSDPSYVPVICEGATINDRLAIGFHGNDQKDPDPIQYFPRDGFPSFFYRPRDLSLPFLKPAMMVRLTSLRDKHMIKINCTAFGQMYDFDGKLLNHELLTTQFSVYMTA